MSCRAGPLTSVPATVKRVSCWLALGADEGVTASDDEATAAGGEATTTADDGATADDDGATVDDGATATAPQALLDTTTATAARTILKVLFTVPSPPCRPRGTALCGRGKLGPGPFRRGHRDVPAPFARYESGMGTVVPSFVPGLQSPSRSGQRWNESLAARLKMGECGHRAATSGLTDAARPRPSRKGWRPRRLHVACRGRVRSAAPDRPARPSAATTWRPTPSRKR